MPVVEKTSGGTVRVRDIGEFSPGDRANVSTADAEYLVEERGDFETVDDGADETDGEAGEDEPDKSAAETDDDAGYLRDEPPATQIEEGVCPWCPPDDRYEGDAVGQHASAAHPDEWAKYKED